MSNNGKRNQTITKFFVSQPRKKREIFLDSENVHSEETTKSNCKVSELENKCLVTNTAPIEDQPPVPSTSSSSVVGVSTEDQLPASTLTPSTSSAVAVGRKQAVTFRREWKTNRAWLVYNTDAKGMFCLLCQKFNKTPFDRDTWTKSPCTRLRLESVVRHENCAAHIDSLKLELQASLHGPISDKIQPSMCEEDLMKAFACLYFLCKKKIPHTTNFEPILDLACFLGVPIKDTIRVAKNANYCSRTSIQDMVISLSTVIENEILGKLQNAPFFSIEIDETTDSAVVEQLVIHARYVDSEGVLQSSFLKIIDILSDLGNSGLSGTKNCTSNLQGVALNSVNISNAVISYLHDSDLCFSKLCGIGTDGAPVLTGKHNGAVKKIREKQVEIQQQLGVENVCEAVGVHCAGHRLNLAVSQAAEKTLGIKKFCDIMRQVFDFYQNSSVRSAGLHELQCLFPQDPQGKVKQPSHTRWLSYGECVLRMKDIYPSVVLSLERECEERNDARARGLCSYVTEFSFIATLLLMCDVLPIMNRLSKIFQQENADLSIVKSFVDSTINKLQRLKDFEGLNEREIASYLEMCASKGVSVHTKPTNAAHFKNIKLQYLQTLIENIQVRFTDCDILTCFSIFNPTHLPSPHDHRFDVYGTEAIKLLSARFGLESRLCLQEWCEIKQYMADNHRKKTCTEVVHFLCTDKTIGSLFPNIAKLAQVYRVIPLHTADCERDFSQMKLIKTDLRNRLSEFTLDSLLRISLEGPDVQDYPFKTAVQHWAAQKNRRIRLK